MSSLRMFLLLCPVVLLAAEPPPLPDPPVAQAEEQPLPINLATALQLADATPLDIALAAQRTQAAAAQLKRANALWLPHFSLGIDYTRHDGRIQDIVGVVFPTSRQALLAGVGPSALFAVSEAIYAPLAARQILLARQAEQVAVRNDTVLAVAQAFFQVQQARGELAGAIDTLTRADDFVRRIEGLAEGLVPPVEIHRAKSERARRRQAVELARQKWETASAELARLLRLPPAALVVPLEPPQLRVELLDLNQPIEQLIGLALASRPELAGQKALVEASLARLRQEKYRPLLPNVLLRGNANPNGLSTGIYGGGVNDAMKHFGYRNSLDAQVFWEFQNLGLGNRAVIQERQAENQHALLEFCRLRDRVAAEVVQAHAQARRAVARLAAAEEEVAEAVQIAQKSLEGFSQTRRIGDTITLVFRPQEIVAAVIALDQAYRDYYAAVAEANQGQFRLYRALGHPKMPNLESHKP
jgi:outer membrane protein TolC